MKKVLVAVIVVLALVLLATPRVVSSITAARVTEQVAAINDSGVMTAELKTYASGWFRSAAKIELGLAPEYLANMAGMAPLGGDPQNLGGRATIAVDFAHGPVAVLDGVHFGWSKIVAHLDPEQPGIAELQQNLGIPYVFEYRARTSFAGTMAFDADVPAIDLPIDGARFQFSGATLAGNYRGGNIEADARIASLDFSSPTGTFAVAGIHMSADNRFVSQYVLPGDAEFSIESVAIVDATRGTTPVFEASNLKFASNSALRESDSLLDMQVTYDLDSMRIDTTQITEAALGVTMRSLDVAALQAYSAAASNFATAGAQDPAAFAATLSPHFERALAAGPSMTLEPIRFRVGGEPLDGRIELVTNTARLPPAGQLNFENPLLVLAIVDGNADLRVSKVLAQSLAAVTARMQLANSGMAPDEAQFMAEAQAGLILVQLTGQGMLVEDGDAYRTAIKFADGTLTVNGNALPFGP
jgi:uncharacterized protein YdgA (DUF945 family)